MEFFLYRLRIETPKVDVWQRVYLPPSASSQAEFITVCLKEGRLYIQGCTLNDILENNIIGIDGATYIDTPTMVAYWPAVFKNGCLPIDV